MRRRNLAGGPKFGIGEIANFTYTGTVLSIELPSGLYKLQCWGALGGSNSSYSSYSISSRSGGKGGYSEGVLTLTSPTTLYIFVGGQGSSSGNGGWNGGGGSSGSSSYTYDSTLYGVTKMACGGGGTDIALVSSTMAYSSNRTNRSSASLLSRIIVAGGGSGGAMCYYEYNSTSTSWSTIGTYSVSCGLWINSGGTRSVCFGGAAGIMKKGKVYKFTTTVSQAYEVDATDVNGTSRKYPIGSSFTASADDSGGPTVHSYDTTTDFSSSTLTLYQQVSSTTEYATTNSQTGYAGGGTSGLGNYPGTQNSAGSGGTFGLGANQTTTNYRFCTAAGGGGWYGGGGGSNSDTSSSTISYSGGGSGFVNTSANASYRPANYTGLQLDSGTTYAGNTSFVSTSGGTETGHAGNGYARITRLS